MIVFSLILLASPREDELNLSRKPLFTTWRNHQGEFFAARRLEHAFIHYYLLHAFPAYVSRVVRRGEKADTFFQLNSTIWSFVMPLQYWGTLRKSRPTLHRFTGYIALSCSLILTLSGLAFIPRQLAFSKPILAMHYIHGIPVFPSFNFGAVFFAAPAMLITGLRAIYLARHKRFAEHRRWAVYHGIAGYFISFQRVWMLLVGVFGTILSNAPKLQALLQTDRVMTLRAKSDAELAAFAFTTWAGGLTSIAWVLYVRRQNALTGDIKLK
jgi:hypothetical protein